jgi:rod shape determining protein RodA
VTRPRLRMPPLDAPLLVAALALVAIGLLSVYSATSVAGAHHGLWMRQLLWAVIALGVGWLVASIHYRAYDALAVPLYIVALILLVLVLVKGSSAMGARRWLELGPLRFQPSELAKIATVLLLARWFDREKLDLRSFGAWFPALLIVLVPFALVAKEPDLGTSLTFPVILVAMLFWAGMPLGFLALGLSPIVNAALYFTTHTLWWSAGVVAVLLALVRPSLRAPASRTSGWSCSLPAWIAVLLLNVAVGYALPHAWDHLHDYQKRRIETFVNPGSDPYHAGYQVIQSRIAIGSGGVSGVGYLKGTQKALAFLPMRHTDFIFSVIGEEWGLLGTVLVVVLYGLLILRGFRLALVARGSFASLMVVGLVAALFYHVSVNVLMTIGWAPVTGLPLPLVSYGGTALLANGIQIGLLQNVAMRRTEM